METPVIVILGAGLAGLSAAWHLQDDHDVLVLEREARSGGLCRSVRQDGFTFDLTGHLLHLRRPEIRKLVLDLVDEERFEKIDRRAFIYSHGVFTPYPFQVNTHGLPAQVVSECLLGFIEASRQGTVEAGEAENLSFADWVLRTFGSGVARHFMYPYNEKLWLVPLSEVTCDWVSWAIPRPSLKDVVEGALGINRGTFGYNPSFLYPREGGIQVLPDALAARVRDVRCGADVAGVDLASRTIRLRSGAPIRYDRLISTLPLPKLVKMAEGLPSWATTDAARLRHTAVININLGVDRVVQPDKHWVYFPEKEFVFYRAGFPASFTTAAAPPGCSSIYLEIAVRPGERPDQETLCEQARQGLIKAGILTPADRILTRAVFQIDPAYVVYDRHRRALVPRLMSELHRRGVHSIGRYGAWHYNSMEDSLAEGRDLALQIAQGASQPCAR